VMGIVGPHLDNIGKMISGIQSGQQDASQQQMQQLMEGLSNVHKAVTAPRHTELVRDPKTGKAIGTRSVIANEGE